MGSHQDEGWREEETLRTGRGSDQRTKLCVFHSDLSSSPCCCPGSQAEGFLLPQGNNTSQHRRTRCDSQRGCVNVTASAFVTPRPELISLES